MKWDLNVFRHILVEKEKEQKHTRYTFQTLALRKSCCCCNLRHNPNEKKRGDIKQAPSHAASRRSLIWKQGAGAAAADDVHYSPGGGVRMLCYEAGGHEGAGVWTGSKQWHRPLGAFD